MLCKGCEAILFFFFFKAKTLFPSASEKEPRVNKTPFVCQASHTTYTNTYTNRLRGADEGRQEAAPSRFLPVGSLNVAETCVHFTAAFLPVRWEHFPHT